MKIIKNKNFWKAVIITVVLISIVTGFTWYINNLQNQLENVMVEKESIEVKMDEILKDLESVKNEHEVMCEELNMAYEKIDSQSKKIDSQSKKIENQSNEIENYKKRIEDEEYKWRKRYEEYSVATEAWIAMKTYGWNDIVCSGIMGNFMAETGGSGTFNLDWNSDGSSGYGLAQWTNGRQAEIKNIYGDYPTVKEQIQFIHDELYGTNGVTRQVEQYQLNAIMEAETPEDCAYAFAYYYERCDEDYRHIRSEYARWAYNYFV